MATYLGKHNNMSFCGCYTRAIIQCPNMWYRSMIFYTRMGYTYISVLHYIRMILEKLGDSDRKHSRTKKYYAIYLYEFYLLPFWTEDVNEWA